MARLSRRSDFPRRSDFRVEHAGLSHLGHVRATNEDVWRAEPNLSLFAVADGMGGHAAGEVAAAMAIDSLVHSVRAAETAKVIDAYALAPSLDGRRAVFAVLRAAFVRANEAVRAEGERNADRRGMGSTLDVVLFVRNRAFVVHVGDGRVYLVRPAATIQLTHDHDLRASMAAEGRASLTSRRGQHNPLLNAIGLRDSVSVDCVFLEIGRGDRLLLCTDGVHQMIGDEAGLVPLARGGRATAAAKTLVDAALARGGRDNATVLVLDVAEPLTPRKTVSHAGADHATARACALLCDLPDPMVLRALAMAAEVEIAPGEEVPRIVTTDRVAYIVLDGEVEGAGGLMIGASGLLYAESLVGVGRHPACRAVTGVRALRLRGDDFREICASDVQLAAVLYERLARHLGERAR